MDRLGTQARQAARTEPAAARRDRHHLRRLAGNRLRCPPDVRYVITLDADTRLPRDTVAPADRQDGPSAQPAALRCRLPAGSSRAMRVLQPRVTPSLPVGREGSLFQRVFSSASGIDPYAAAVSDVYQDLFGEGSYTGKGIYDVDAFEAALAGRVPELDPAQPRPVRGHLRPRRPRLGRRGRRGVSRPLRRRRPAPPPLGARRLAACCPGSSGADLGADRGSGGVPAIGRWKMLDNLRRTLSAPSCVLALIAGWALPLRRRGASGPASSSRRSLLPPLIPVVGAIRAAPRRRDARAAICAPSARICGSRSSRSA